jgi:hypothetical protein
MEDIFPSLPGDIRLVILQYVTLKDITSWALNVQESFLLEKLKNDYQELIYNPNQVINWKDTFHHLQDLEERKAKTQVIKMQDLSGTDWDFCELRLYGFREKYPLLQTFTIGNVCLLQEDPSRVFFIQGIEQHALIGHIIPNDHKRHVFLEEDPIYHIPLEYWSRFYFSILWTFFLPSDAKKVVITYDDGTLLVAWIFIHCNVSFAVVVGNVGMMTYPFGVIYPCAELLPNNMIWMQCLKTYRLANNRVFMSYLLYQHLTNDF